MRKVEGKPKKSGGEQEQGKAQALIPGGGVAWLGRSPPVMARSPKASKHHGEDFGRKKNQNKNRTELMAFMPAAR